MSSDSVPPDSSEASKTVIVMDNSNAEGAEEAKDEEKIPANNNCSPPPATEVSSSASTTTTTTTNASPTTISSTVLTSFPNVSLRMNEFGIYELTQEDSLPKPAITIQDSISIKPVDGSQSERWKANIEIVCCKHCDGYGIADEFVDKSYCSEKCRKLATARLAAAKISNTNITGKIQASKRKSINNADGEQSSSPPPSAESAVQRSDRSATLDVSSSDIKSSKSFSWSKYLEKRRSQAAPERLFSDPFPYGKHGFRPGMKLEGIDPEHQSLFCVLTVAEVQGYRIRLHFDGYSDSHDFWVNADSENLFPCGWCEKNGQKLQSPKNHDPQRPFTWTVYLKQSGVGAAPRHLFCSTQNEYPVPSAFRVKMKLEAVDRRHSSHTLCVATVANVIGSRFLVHFDGWDDIYDYWADPSCPYVHPVGWSQEHNMPLTPPCDYDASEGEFSWERYLAQAGSTAVPPRAFKPRSPVGFKAGMKLECVDPRNPQLIRVATVGAVKGYRLKIHFDGWSTDFDFWTDDDWPDLHPPGWCSKTGHPLQPPPSGSESAPSPGECPTPGCNGIGHIEGAKYATHRNVEHCPYYSRNLHRENPPFPDRLAGEETTSEEKHPKEENRKGKTPESKSSKNSHSEGSFIDMEVSMASPIGSGSTVLTSTPSAPAKLSEGETVAKMVLDSDRAKPKVFITESKVRSIEESRNQSRSIEVEMKAESPLLTALQESYEDSPAHTPPNKKPKLSFFTGKLVVSEGGVMVRKSTSSMAPPSDEARGRAHPDSLKRDLKVEKNDIKEENAHVVELNLSGSSDARTERQRQKRAVSEPQIQRSVMEDFVNNSNLTTPLCWSRHINLLSKYVDQESVGVVTQWTVEQVVEFLVKFGMAEKELDKFKAEEIDGEALLCLSQSDLVDILQMKLGPAIKIHNALLLLKEKPQPVAES